MKPKFSDPVAWQQAELLMQPALIRIIDRIRQQLEKSPWTGTYREVKNPDPGYELCLELNDRKVIVEIWELCYQVCFSNYQPTHASNQSYEVEIDTTLIDEAGEVDWANLDAKAQQVTAQIFDNLPLNSEQ